tara:strand:- start:10683 stop:11516 length:834 start_codon:yes stop_codon:yes gene_type:complete
MKVVLVMLNNFQKYIVYNIENLKLYGNNDITLITDEKFFKYFEKYNINLIPVDKLIKNYTVLMNTLKNTFRNGFWKLTTFRFNAIYNFMKQYNIKNIVHIENDVLVYENLNNIIFHDKNKILITMDAKNRCIPGIMFIPNFSLLQTCLTYFENNLNDMQNFAICYHKTNIIDTLPIFINNTTHTKKFEDICKNYDKYNVIFDAAAIGQYLGGIDPRIKSSNTIGFVNETCIVDYSNFKFVFEKEKGKHKPFIIVNNKKIQIINLHIHSKHLNKFIFK